MGKIPNPGLAYLNEIGFRETPDKNLEKRLRKTFGYCKKLIEKGYLISGCYNNARYDRTTWYTFGPKGEELYLLDEKKRRKHLN